MRAVFRKVDDAAAVLVIIGLGTSDRTRGRANGTRSVSPSWASGEQLKQPGSLPGKANHLVPAHSGAFEHPRHTRRSPGRGDSGAPGAQVADIFTVAGVQVNAVN